MRTIVELPGDQLASLAKFCAREKISRAEAVRRAVGSLLQAHRPAKNDAGFGAWRSKKVNSRQLVSKLRAEWTRP
jgi:metal-responsive CopG/Arc/MetJ family transcriptional regulator